MTTIPDLLIPLCFAAAGVVFGFIAGHIQGDQFGRLSKKMSDQQFAKMVSEIRSKDPA